ncbi:ATP-binding cassette domain-containing protein [Paenibacillus sp. HW567]|uniref:ATP-binding cassette domain-containing protein n=1 Tax=Paenibacillus sp. HW567 TaxID=1034769 RepID=UPI000380FBE1|nr:ATP-binding cassette domain-containing protein [Paenibacillus sp. HW567]
MESTVQGLAYQAFGLQIHSEFPLPELPLADKMGLAGSVSVVQADLAERWQAIPKVTSSLGVSGNEVMFEAKGTAVFSIQGGNTITVSPAPEADPDCVRLFILGSCMGVLLMQKQILPLHGSALVIDGQAYALVGRSGAGKSTLASYLMDQGSPLISDDVIPVMVQNGHPLAIPGYPQQKLWQQSLDYLGMNSSLYRPLFERETKFAVPVHDRFHSEPLPLAGVFELSVTREGPVALEPIQGMQRFHALYHHTYQRAIVDRIGIREWHFGMLASFINRLPMYRLTRPEQGFNAPAQASLILETIRQQVKER